MYELRDTFNDCPISTHRTALAAGKANRKHQAKVKRANGPTCYIPTTVSRIEAGNRITLTDSEQAEYARGYGYID